MPVKPACILLDLGGVVLTNGWDRGERQAAARRFGCDPDAVEARHAEFSDALETGRISLAAYIQNVLIPAMGGAAPAPADEIAAWIFQQSQPLPGALEHLAKLASGPWLLAALNNESAELNQYRIRQFGLQKLIRVFFSSCYMGLRKPDVRIYQQALRMLQQPPEAVLAVDDRPENLAAARSLGMATVRIDPPGNFTPLWQYLSD